MATLKDMTGKTVGRLMVLRRAPLNIKGAAAWECQCTCGTIVTVTGANMRSGNSRSCGCLLRLRYAINRRRRTRHNLHDDLAEFLE